MNIFIHVTPGVSHNEFLLLTIISRVHEQSCQLLPQPPQPLADYKYGTFCMHLLATGERAYQIPKKQ